MNKSGHLRRVELFGWAQYEWRIEIDSGWAKAQDSDHLIFISVIGFWVDRVAAPVLTYMGRRKAKIMTMIAPHCTYGVRWTVR